MLVFDHSMATLTGSLATARLRMTSSAMSRDEEATGSPSETTSSSISSGSGVAGSTGRAPAVLFAYKLFQYDGLWIMVLLYYAGNIPFVFYRQDVMGRSRGHQHRIACEFRLPAYAHAVSRRAAYSSSNFRDNLAAGDVSNVKL